MDTVYGNLNNTDTKNCRKRKYYFHFTITGDYQATIVNILQLKELIQQQKDEIARLKGQKPKPKIRPSNLEEKCKKKKKFSSGKRPDSKKRSKTADLIIHKEIPIPPESIQPGSIFKEYQPYTVQGKISM